MTCTYKTVPIVLHWNGRSSRILSTCLLVYGLLFYILSGKLLVY